MVKIRKAQLEDIEPILNLLSPHVKAGIVLQRSYEEIANAIDHFFVALDETKVIGVVSYFDYGTNLKEIRSLAVDQNSQSSGIGKKLVLFVINYILDSGVNTRIFTLSYIPNFFKKIDFIEVKKDTFPEKIWKDCSKCSKIDCCDEIALEYKRG